MSPLKEIFVSLVFLLILSNSFIWASSEDSCEVADTSFEGKVLELFSLDEVITYQEIDEGISKSLRDALIRFRLIDIISYGIYGQPEIANIWGSENLLFLEDDIPLEGEALYLTNSSLFDLNSFPTNNIDTLKIIEGGVANIFSNRAGLGCVKIKGKNFNSQKPYSKAWFQRGPDHYRHTRIELGRGFFSSGKIYLTGEFKKYGGKEQNSDIDSRYFTCKTSFDLRSNLKLDLDALHYSNEMGIPSYDENLRARKDQSDWRLNLKTSYKPNRNHLLAIDLFYSPEDQELKNVKTSEKEKKKERTLYLRVREEGDFGRHHFLFTSYLGKEKLEWFDYHSIWKGYISGADIFQLHPKISFLLFLKLHKLEDFKKRFSALGGISYSPTVDFTLYGTGGRFYNFPSLFDLYPPSDEEIVQRGNLEEQSFSEFNLGVKWVKDIYKIRLGLVKTEIEDDILYRDGLSENFDNETYGSYLSFSFDPHPNFSAFTSYSYKDVKYKQNRDEYSMPFIPQNSAFSYIQYKKEFLKKEIEIKLRLEGEYLSKRYLEYEEKDKVSEVFVLNSKITVRLLDFHLYGVVNNITDQEYKSKGEYYMPQREILLGFYWEFWD